MSLRVGMSDDLSSRWHDDSFIRATLLARREGGRETHNIDQFVMRRRRASGGSVRVVRRECTVPELVTSF